MSEPLVCPWGTPTEAQWDMFAKMGDVNRDGVIDIRDYHEISYRFFSVIGDALYDPSCDLNEDGVIDIDDMMICGVNYNKRICTTFSNPEDPEPNPTYEYMNVYLWQRKLSLGNMNADWTYTQERTFNSISTAVGVRLKGTIKGTVNADIIEVSLLVNDNEVGTYQPGDATGNLIAPVDVDIRQFLYDPSNSFGLKIYKKGAQGYLAWCEIRADVYVELKYKFGELPTPPPTPVTNCFVATVAFGSPLAKELDVIRSFRDRRLPNPLVKSYYRWGKWLARFIEKRRAFKAWMRAFLWLVFVRKR